MTDTRGSIKDGIKGVHSQPVGPVHNGVKSVLTSVYKEGGVRGLYRGVGMYIPDSTNTSFMHGNHNWFLLENSVGIIICGKNVYHSMFRLSSLAFYFLIQYFQYTY